MSEAGSSLLRTTLVRAADNARRADPQLARVCYVRMVERGKDHLGAVCVVAASLAERFWAVMHGGSLRDLRHRRPPGRRRRSRSDHRRTLDRPRRRSTRRRRSNRRAPRTVPTGRPLRGDLPRHRSIDRRSHAVNISPSEEPLDNESSIGDRQDEPLEHCSGLILVGPERGGIESVPAAVVGEHRR